MRYIAAIAMLGVLTGCGSEKSSGDVAPVGQDGEVASESLDKDELSEDLATALISEKAPEPDCSYFMGQQFYSAETPQTAETGNFERFVTGRDALPRNFTFGGSIRDEWDYDGLDALIANGILTAEHVRDYTTKSSGFTFPSHVYKIDFSQEAKQSTAVRINVNNSVTDGSGVLAAYCPGPVAVSNVKYVVPNDTSFSSATFSWQLRNIDPFGERLTQSGFWPRPQPTSGTGTASFTKTNAGWEVSRVELD